MADLVFVATALGFLGLCVLYVRGCQRVVAGGGGAGPDEVER